MTRNLDARSADTNSNGGKRFWLSLFGILLTALVLRLVFFRGPFGSDDNVYITRALYVALGEWPSSTYIGSLRYGFNIPAGFFVWLFGPSVFAANIYPLLLSLGEIGVVGALMRRPMGDSAALIAALLLAFLPLHIGTSTALHADAVLAFFLTLSFTLFWTARHREHWIWWVAAGLAVGMVYWVKEVVIIFALVFLAYAVLANRWSWGYIHAGAAAIFLFLLNCALMWAVEGDPFHILNVVRTTASDLVNQENRFAGLDREQSPVFYFKYLFILIYHTWIIGYLALAGLVLLCIKRGNLSEERREFLSYICFWLLGMLAVFSLLPISFSPLTLIWKQSNYLSMFLAPLVLMAAAFIVRLEPKLQLSCLAIFLSGSVLLAGLKQQDLRAFVANGKAVFNYAVQERQVPIYGSQRNYGLAITLARASAGLDAVIPVLPVSNLFEADYVATTPTVLVAFDPVTHRIGTEGYDANSIPTCWELVRQLHPVEFGAGLYVSQALSWVAGLVPIDIATRISSRLTDLNRPQPAVLYSVPASDPLCAQ